MTGGILNIEKEANVYVFADELSAQYYALEHNMTDDQEISLIIVVMVIPRRPGDIRSLRDPGVEMPPRHCTISLRDATWPR
jgi:hypothetical protein